MSLAPGFEMSPFICSGQRWSEMGQHMLQMLLHHTFDGVLVVDERARVVVFNPAAEKMTGLSAGRVLGRSIQTLGEFCVLLRRVYGNGRPHNGEICLPEPPAMVVNRLPVAQEELKNYAWPGNVRELEGFVERYVALGEEDTDRLTTFRSLLQKLQLRQLGAVVPDQQVLVLQLGKMEEMERQIIEQAMGIVRGGKGELARLLGLSRTTLWKKLKKYRLDGSVVLGRESKPALEG
ncbi:MAG: helix-turn-helix domain-containing protein [Desulfurispora sp.]|uniref:helix-turn-helix domain-containing protein n=1 Tax=Desulfurispora sp. TaxID=3014275 RepID=UPI00404A6059